MTVPRTICLGFLFLVMLGTALLLLPVSISSGWGVWKEPIAAIVTALFTATSAVCVTGLATVDVGNFYTPFGQAVVMLLFQVGGLGYMTVTTVLLLLLGRKFRLRDKLALQQTLETQGLSEVQSLLKSIVAFTLVFELTGTFLLLPIFQRDYGLSQGLWLALFHSVSAFNNAGFSLFSDNLVSYGQSPLVLLVISGLIITGGIGYQVIREIQILLRDRLSRSQEHINLSLNFKIVTSTTVLLLLLGTVAFLTIEFHDPDTLGPLNPGQKLLASWFQSVSARTAGFNSLNIGNLPAAALFVTIVLMFIGGGPGGTAGGIKVTTFRVLLVCALAVLEGKEEVHAYDRQIPIGLILKAISVAVGSLLLVTLVVICLAITDYKIPFINLLFEAVSAFGTVGLSTGITAQLSLLGKLLIIATMYSGRVGVLLLMAAVWGGTSPSRVRRPEENLLVG